MIGVSFWDSKESCDEWRASEAEGHRREAMAPYLVHEEENFYRGRELAIPRSEDVASPAMLAHCHGRERTADFYSRLFDAGIIMSREDAVGPPSICASDTPRS